MSLNARRYHCRRHLCACGRPALFFSLAKRRVRARPDHSLCGRCWRSALDAARSRLLAFSRARWSPRVPLAA
jgi:hypothetical protein